MHLPLNSSHTCTPIYALDQTLMQTILFAEEKAKMPQLILRLARCHEFKNNAFPNLRVQNKTETELLTWMKINRNGYYVTYAL